jgi:hypothetical protein
MIIANQINFYSSIVLLIYYMLANTRQAVTHIWVAVIQIDVHHIGETWYTQYVSAHEKSYVATFNADSIELDKSTTPKKGLLSW